MALSERRISRLGWVKYPLFENGVAVKWRWINPSTGGEWVTEIGEEPSIIVPHFQGACSVCDRDTRRVDFNGCPWKPCPHGFQEDETLP